MCSRAISTALSGGKAQRPHDHSDSVKGWRRVRTHVSQQRSLAEVLATVSTGSLPSLRIVTRSGGNRMSSFPRLVLMIAARVE